MGDEISEHEAREGEQEKLDGKGLREKGQKWLDKINSQQKLEETWRKNAQEATLIYTGEGDKPAPFNILFSNVETIVPSIYNSTPAPDVRRRFSDPDPISKSVSQVIERAISLQLDNGALDGEIEALAQDAFIAGRGVVRVRSLEGGGVQYESVPWRDYVEGPAKRWRDVPWVAFRHSLVREESEKITSDSYVQAQVLDNGVERLEGEPKDTEDVWEIWCRGKGKVLFVRDRDAMLLNEMEDPLGLAGFFPMPEPAQPITVSGRRMPVNPYSIYRGLAEELNRLTTRINKITEGMKVRGGVVSGQGAADVEALSKAGDNELVEIKGVEIAAQAGGLDKLISWWPIEAAAKVLAQLVQQREQVKQAIYEITGISDIVRGASRSSETATAQQIKTQWGSLRIKKMQRMVEATVRDLFQMTADIMARTTPAEQLTEMTGIQVTPEMEVLLSKPVLRSYRIDVESDSTVRADVSRNQEQMNQFLQGTAQFIQAVGPAIQSGQFPPEVAMEIYSSFARSFKLGKQAEDALDSLSGKLAEQAQQKQGNEQQAAAMADADKKRAETDIDLQRREAELGLREEAMKVQAERLKLDSATAAHGIDRKAFEHEATMRGGQIVQREGEIEGVRAELSPVMQAIEGFGQIIMQMQAGQQERDTMLLAALTAPKQVTLPDGRTITATTGGMQ